MASARLRAHIAALLAVLLAVWPAAASVHARFFCRMMDRVVDSCCCRSESAPQQVDPQPEARVPDCCERLTQGALPSADARRDMVKSFSSPLLLAASEVRVVPEGVAQVIRLSLEHQGGVAARGPPLFLANCALLI
jgi:hypothetical protein